MKIFLVSEENYLIVNRFLRLAILYLLLSDVLSDVLCFLLCSVISHPVLFKGNLFKGLLKHN